MNRKLMIVAFFLVAGMCLVVSGQEIKSGMGVYVFAAGNGFLKNGETGDYRMGINEFPLTDSHLAYGVGFGVISSRNRELFFGFEVGFNFSEHATVRDPVDNDSAEIETYPHMLGFLTLGVRLLRGPKVSVHLQVGGGGFYTLENQATTVITEKGYLLEIVPADDRSGFAGMAGLGIDYMFSSRAGLILCGRYLYLAAENPQSAVSILCGLQLIL